MHSLLQRQLKKHFQQEELDSPGFQSFLDAIGKSYENFDEKLSMMQRATIISSEELYEANVELQKEAQHQKQVLASLEKAMTNLTSEDAPDNDIKTISKSNITAEKLTAHISNLADQIAEITTEKNILLKDLEAQNESLNNYAHAVSHDIKSPIRNISTLISWIKESENNRLSEDGLDNFALVEENLEKMDRLVDSILKHATIETLDEEKSNINLNNLLNGIQSSIYIPSNVSLIFNERLPTLFAQKYKIEQLFTNLITNAITATEHLDKGIIAIDFEEQDDFWQFSCSDNGIGIEEKHRHSIFEMFKKLENNFNATGIGLALVKKIINLYGGRIWIESEINEGTTFFFTLKK
ncbi:MAG TPA: GHKL domain-containing protein [Pricia antarctica]|uniref:histidine kinase n=2 Tax=root TaxID=1 RepID=A0A831QU49_9FLAO|nr:GHKL domain-containing protein [Pricia antarctica]